MLSEAAVAKKKITVIVDTREQKPFCFKADPSVTTVHAKLDAGDYSVAGFEATVAVERKTLEDFAGSITRNRGRFFREIGKLSKMTHSCVVVEDDLSGVFSPEFISGVHPASLVGTAVAIGMNYGVPVFFCGNRYAAELWTVTFLRRATKRCDDGKPNSRPRKTERDRGQVVYKQFDVLGWSASDL